MDLKHTVKTTICVQGIHFDAFVNERLGFDNNDRYFFQAAEELCEGESRTYDVDAEPFKTWERPQEVLDGNWVYGTKTILKVLCQRGLIEPGHYIITG